MAYLKLRRIDGVTEKRELSRSQPLTIGRQQFNDICIPENDVSPFHCRIGWNKTKFEVTSATSNGVEVNSTTVVHFELKPGDVIRVGSVDLIFEDDSKPVAAKIDSPGTRKSRPRPAEAKSETKPEPKEKPAKDISSFEGDVFTESQALLTSLLNDDLDEDLMPTKHPEAKRLPVEDVRGVRQTRPGEQEILRSPLVLSLTAGGLLLLLITGIFWFLLSREQSKRMYDRAVEEMNSGQFAQSVSSFERFIQQYPNHGLRRQANRGLAKSLVLKEISGAAPAWKRGLERLNELITSHRSDSDFSEMHSTLFLYAEQISLGAAKAAESARDPEMLVISKDAQDLVERYADPSAPPIATIGRINEQRVKADRAIAKQKTFDLAMKTIDEAIANQKPMVALSERLRLVKTFPEFANSKRVKDILQKSLDLERSVVAVDDSERIANTKDDPPPSSEPILGILHARSRTDEASQGQIVFVVAKDSCFAIDATTGELVWRRVIGANSPFFPLTLTGAQSSVLLFDTRKNELVACQLASGKLLWRQALNATAIGKPLVHEGQIYLPIEGSSLVRIDTDSGRLSATVKFSQNLAATPALSHDGNYLLVPGEMAMIYSLSLRSTSSRQNLAAVATTFTDHAAGSVSAPPLSMGKLLLVCENDLADSAKLRLWDASNPAESLVELSTTRTSGQVRDLPVLRGNQLVVPSAGEQFAAFVVTDDAGHAGISPVGQYRADQTQSGKLSNLPIFVALGSDGQFWSASSAFRRFEIVSDSIRMDSNSSAPGIASQPLQLRGDYFYVGRKSRYSDAVTFSAIDREKLVNPWRCIVGDTPLDLLAARDGGVFWIGESGTIYSLSKNRLGLGGVDSKAGTDLELPNNIAKPIRATVLPDQRMVVAVSGDTKQLLVLNASGQVVGKHPLSEMIETDPVLLDEGLILPLPGRLKLLPLAGGNKNAQDWISPAGDGREQRWTHLVRIDGRELIACSDSGRLTRIQFRQGDVPHLAEVAKLQLEQSVDLRPVLRGESLYLADAAATCRQLNVHSFDTDGQRAMTPPLKNLWSADKHLLVQAGADKLHCLADGKDLPERWTFDLAKLEPTGSIYLKDEAIWLACRNGTILVINLKSGNEIRRIELPQSISLGIRKINEQLFAVATDGTLYRLE